MGKYNNLYAFDFGSKQINVFFENQNLSIPADNQTNDSVDTPLIQRGKLANFRETHILLKSNLDILQKPFLGIFRKQFSSIVSVSPKIGDVGKVAFRDLLVSLGSKHVYMIDDYLLTGLGLNIPIDDEFYCVVDFGYGKSSISTVYKSQLIKHDFIDTSLMSLLIRIQNHFLLEYKIKIENQDVENIFWKHTFTKSPNDQPSIVVSGHRFNSNEMCSEIISSSEINSIWMREISDLINALRRHIELLDIDSQMNVLKNGIHIVGKSAQLPGLLELIEATVPISPISYDFQNTPLHLRLQKVMKNPKAFEKYFIQ